MAQPITWRNVGAASQNDAVNFTQFGANQINRGLTGLQNQVSGIAQEQEQAVLDNALAQINQLGSVDAVRNAQDKDFVSLLSNGDDALTNQLRTALGNRGTQLEQQFVSRNAFDDTVRSQEERGIIANYQNALTNRDDAAAENFLGQLSTETQAKLRPELIGFRDNQLVGGFQKDLADGNLEAAKQKYDLMSPELQGEHGGSFNAARKTAATKDYSEKIFSGIQNRLSLSANLQTLRERFPNVSDDMVIKDGKITAREGSKLAPETLDGMIQSVFPDMSTEGLSYAQLQNQALLTQPNDDIDVNTILRMSELVGNTQQLDNTYRDQAKYEAAQAQSAKEIAQLQTDNAIARNPVDPALTAQEGLTMDAVFQEFLPLTQSAGGWWDVGQGDFANFRKTVEEVINEGNYNPVVVREALNATTEVNEARNEGNLGDSWGDNIDKKEFRELLKLFQTKYDNNELRNAINLDTQARNIKFQNGVSN